MREGEMEIFIADGKYSRLKLYKLISTDLRLTLVLK